MRSQVQQQWLSQFEELQDPRGLQGQTHAFLSIVLIAILATTLSLLPTFFLVTATRESLGQE